MKDLSEMVNNPQVPSQQVTKLLMAWSDGDPAALDALAPLLYEELRRLAHSYMRREPPGHTLQSTAVVHEAYIRLVDQHIQWNGRAHFLATAAQMMRRILVDHARSRAAAKRGSGAIVELLEDDLIGSDKRVEDMLALDEILDRLAKVDPQRDRIIELKFFGGLSKEETAAILGISPATVQRQWSAAKVWLHHELTRRGKP